MSEPVTLICSPTHRIPEPVAGAEVRWCSICAEEVWVSPASKAVAESEDDLTIICTACAPGVMEAEKGKLIPPTPEQKREVEEWMKGRTDR